MSYMTKVIFVSEKIYLSKNYEIVLRKDPAK